MDITSLTFDERDEFSRGAIAEKVISLIKADVNTSPMVIDGDWGTGKSEFCHKLINLMEKSDSHHLIYVDAFKADHAGEPLMTILAEVIKVIPEDKVQSFTEKALPAVRYSLKALARAAISHVLRQDFANAADNFDAAIQQTADKAIDASVESLLNDHIDAEKNLTALQEALKDIAVEKPIVLFIDELDRCKPSFSVEMLEIIKHTFDVVGVDFVLITNTEQLRSSIRHSYGLNDAGAQRYLDKFLKFTFKLPSYFSFQGDENHSAAFSHYTNLVQMSPILEGSHLHEDGLIDIVQVIIQLHGVSLREVETLVRHLEIYQTLTEGEGFKADTIFGVGLLQLFGVIIFSLKPKLADQFLEFKTDAKQIGEFLGVNEIKAAVSYPSHNQTIAFMLGTESSINPGLFTPEAPENMEKWDRLGNSLFSGTGEIPANDRRNEIVRATLKTMILNN